MRRMGGREEMTLVCSKCGSGNIVDDMDYGNRLAYKKCLMCGNIRIKENIKIKEVTEDMMPKTITPEPGMYTRLEYIRQQTGEKLVDFCGRIGISRSQWHNIRNPHPLGVTILARIADNLKINYDWMVRGTGPAPDKINRIAPEPVHDAGYLLPEENITDGGKELNKVKTVDSQESTEGKKEAVGSGNKAVKVLEMYEMKDNHRLATIGIKDGKYQHVYVEGVDKHEWSYDDVMFLGDVAQEIKRLVQA